MKTAVAGSIALSIVALVQVVRCYPNGSPPSVCTYLYVKHDHRPPQTSPTPYNVSMNASEYSPGDVIPIRLFSPNGRTFKGFQIRVTRQTGNTEELVGQFIDLSQGVKGQTWYPMVPDTYNCATHSDSGDKREVTLAWQAPTDSVGDVTISAIFTYEFNQFWIGQNTVNLKATVPSQDPPYENEVLAMSADIDHDACGASKGCFRYPRGCNGPDCRYVVTYEVDVNKDIVTMEMMGVSRGYISLAIGKSIHMPDAETYSCVKSGDQLSFQHGWNPALHNERHSRDEFSNITIRDDGEKLYCRFQRPLVSSLVVHGKPVESDIRQEAFVHVAWGDVIPASDAVLMKHAELPIVSDSKVNFLRPTIVSGTTMHTSLAAHGVLGLVAWLALAGVAMITARHYRNIFNDILFGAAVWFQLHRALLITTAILTAASIIVIFVHLKIWTEYANAHAITGLVTMGLALVLIGSGYLRPGLNSKLRPYFNWGHRLVGVGTAILAVVTCVLGSCVTLIEADLRRILFIVILVWLGFHVAWDLLLEVLVKWYFSKAARRYNVAEAGKTHMQEGDADGKLTTLKSKKTTVLMALYGCYLIIVIVFVIVSSYYICSY